MEKVEGARSHALWLYGVIIGLAITESLSTTLPHALAGNPAIASPAVFIAVPGEGIIRQETMRLVAFLIMSVRFYLGAAAYAGKCKDEEYKLDLLFGTLHFILFYAWAITVPVMASANRPPAAEHWYLTVLIVILLFNLMWWMFRRILVGQPLYMVRLWTVVNLGTALVCTSVFSYLRFIHHWYLRDAEFFVVAIVIVVSTIDIAEIIQYADGSKGYFSRWGQKLMHPDPKPADRTDHGTVQAPAPQQLPPQQQPPVRH
jgi:hypothetical protein